MSAADYTVRAVLDRLRLEIRKGIGVVEVSDEVSAAVATLAPKYSPHHWQVGEDVSGAFNCLSGRSAEKAGVARRVERRRNLRICFLLFECFVLCRLPFLIGHPLSIRLSLVRHSVILKKFNRSLPEEHPIVVINHKVN